MSESWLKELCPKCKKANWLCQGDLSDLTQPDVDGLKCWNCGHEWVFPELDEDEDITIEDAYIKDGLEKPR